MIGTYVDQYLITAKLGNGSLGETFCAESSNGNQRVVVKLIEPQLLQKSGFANRLTELIRSSERSKGEFMLPISYEVTNGRSYLKTPYLVDGSLQAYLQKLRGMGKWIEAETAVSLIYHILTQLREDHVRAVGYIVHGALHPRNMLLNFEQSGGEKVRTTLILTDFGQAELVRRCSNADDVQYQGLAPYTPSHLWQKEGDEAGEVADERADLYALGHLLYFLLHKKHLSIQNQADDQNDVILQFEELSKKASDEKTTLSFVESATYIALTAVRIYTHSSGKNNLWLRWQYALERLIRHTFEITPSPEKVDPIWQGIEHPALLWPEQFSSLLYIPSIAPQDKAAETSNGQTIDDWQKRPSNATTYIEVNRQQMAGDKPEPHRFYTIRPGQGMITVGSDAQQDITLSDDSHIVAHHLNIVRQGDLWQIKSEANHARLGTEPLTRQLTRWPIDVPLIMGKYSLHLRQPDADDDSDQYISLLLLPSIVEVAPGFQERVGISIRNKGTERGYFKLQIEDLVAAEGELTEAAHEKWCTLPQDGVVLNSGEQQELTLIIHPPMNAASQSCSFAVVVQRITTSISEQIAHQQKLTIRVLATAEFDLKLTPLISRNNGRFQLDIHNASNRTMAYTVHSQDDTHALQFAVVGDAVKLAEPESKREVGSRQATSASSGQTISPTQSTPLSRFAARLFGRTTVGKEIRKGSAIIRGQQRKSQAVQRMAGQMMPSLDVKMPKVKQNKLTFNKQVTKEITVNPGQPQALFLAVEPRKRPFRWRASRDIPFSLMVTPAGNEEPKTETAVLHATSHFSRAEWLLLSGLLLLGCLLLSSVAAFRVNNTRSSFQADQATAVAFSITDPDGDGLSSYYELIVSFTDPYNPDSDGDSISDGVEDSLAYRGVCPDKIDCDGDGVPDPIAIDYPTSTPELPPQANYPTAMPTPTATMLPTVTPTAVSTPIFTPEAAQLILVPFNNSDTKIELGDTQENKQLPQTLYFNLPQPPTGTTLVEVKLLLVMVNETAYERLKATLGNVYATVGTVPLGQQFVDFQIASEADLEALSLMTLFPSNNKLLITTLKPNDFPESGEVSVQLFFELASNNDNVADQLTIWSPIMAGAEHVPTLFLSYEPTADTSE